MHRFSCPHCGKHLSYQITQLGMRIKCPKCKQSIKVGMSDTAGGAAPAGFAAALTQDRWKVALASTLVIGALVLLWRMLA